MRRNGNPVIATVCGRCEKPQQVKGVIGKDEVSSSNLDSSSKKLLKSLDFGSFSSVFPQNNVGQEVGQAG